jgi:hypothetical protein
MAEKCSEVKSWFWSDTSKSDLHSFNGEARRADLFVENKFQRFDENNQTGMIKNRKNVLHLQTNV